VQVLIKIEIALSNEVAVFSLVSFIHSFYRHSVAEIGTPVYLLPAIPSIVSQPVQTALTLVNIDKLIILPIRQVQQPLIRALLLRPSLIRPLHTVILHIRWLSIPDALLALQLVQEPEI
jgi:hypothetical protein